MAKTQTALLVEGTEIRFYQERDEDYFSLTDIAKKFNERTDQVILNWMRTRSTVDFLGAWEMLHNASFNPLNFEGIRNQTGTAAFVLTISDWTEQTAAIGIRANRGRYGGTFAHKDIAFEFLSYLSPTFKLYVFKEFQRLKEAETEARKDALGWNLKRELSKINYRLHTDAVQKHLIAPRALRARHEGAVYASEADLLNIALFDLTAKEWQAANPDLRGNIRDYASAEELLVLANLETLNADYLKNGFAQDERLQKLTEAAIYQLGLLAGMRLNLPAGK